MKHGSNEFKKGDAHLNPYKYYAQGLGPDDDAWEFLASSSNNDGLFQSADGRLMELEFPLPPRGSAWCVLLNQHEFPLISRWFQYYITIIPRGPETKCYVMLLPLIFHVKYN